MPSSVPDLERLSEAELGVPSQPAFDSYEAERRSIENAKEQEYVDNAKQDRKLRDLYSHRLFWLVASWLGVVAIVLLLNGFHVVPFHLSDNVLTALLGTATASVIGLLVIVAKYLFPGQ